MVVSLRWRIAFILSIAIAISYLDRQALSVAVAAIQQDIPLSIPTDLFPRSIVASVAGLVGFGAAMGGIVSNLMAGRLLDLGMGYGVVFSIVGTFHVLAFILILLTIPNIRPMTRN